MNLGPPEVGEAVQVKWPDGLFYGAKYLGSNISYMYQVLTHKYVEYCLPSLHIVMKKLLQYKRKAQT